jgi:hypothetical protein
MTNITKQEQNQNLLHDVLSKLSNNGRLTGKDILFDGVSLNAKPNPLPNVEYDKDGLSIEVSKYNGFKVKEIEELFDKKRATGDEDWIKVINNQAEYYCFISPNRTYSEKNERLIKQNQSRNWAMSVYKGQIDKFFEIGASYINSETGEELFRPLRGMEYFDKNWKRQSPKLKRIPNHATLANGNFTDSQHPEWKEEFRDRIIDWVSYKIQYEYDHINDFPHYGEK